jgi:hypothetical protein
LVDSLRWHGSFLCHVTIKLGHDFRTSFHSIWGARNMSLRFQSF